METLQSRFEKINEQLGKLAAARVIAWQQEDYALFNDLTLQLRQAKKEYTKIFYRLNRSGRHQF